ncbi:MAG: PIN domain-containing protein, partial [Nanoarchaeota archaeon]
MIKVILDTNFLIYCAENKLDYATEIDSLMNEGYELVVPAQVVMEIEELGRTAKKFSDRTASFLALKILRANNVKIVPANAKYADEAIISLMRIGDIVATLDQELKNKLRKSRVIVIQGVKKLAF